MTRRELLAMGGGAAVTLALPRGLWARGTGRFAGLPRALKELETARGGRLGVAVVDTGSGERAGYRAGERFAMCSTFKMLLAAAVLQRVDTGREEMARTLAVPVKPLIGNSPLTEEHAGGEMTVAALCGAILTRSDNTAANLLLETIGGPAGMTRFARSLGDGVTRLDRTETALNEAKVGDPRDTTSPEAMVGDLQKLLVGEVLKPRSREMLTQWMIENKTGLVRLRAKLPEGWRGGDKTGSNLENTAGDIGILWPRTGAPVLVAAYVTECPGPEEKRNGVLAEVGRLVVQGYA